MKQSEHDVPKNEEKSSALPGDKQALTRKTENKVSVTMTFLSKRLPLLGAIFGAAILLAGILALVLTLTRPNQEVELHLDFKNLDERHLQVLRELERRYTSLNQGTSLSYSPSKSDEQYDIRFISGPLTPELEANFQFIAPWTGNNWFLISKTSLMKRIEEFAATEIKALREGTLTPEAFAALLELIQSKGLQALSIGNSHGWPYIMWLQHWTAALFGVATVTSLPSVDDTAAYARLEKAHSELQTWKTKKLFDPKGWQEGWAMGLSKIAQGEAVFALTSAEYLTPFSGQPEGSYEILPFPKLENDPRWAIGSVRFLAIPKSSKHAEAARAYINFLTSPGVRAELVVRLQEPFLSWDEESKAYPVVHASWAEAALSTAYERLLKQFTP